jgi:hypothetical protein
MKFVRRNHVAGFCDRQYCRMSDVMITEDPNSLSVTIHFYSSAVQLNRYVSDHHCTHILHFVLHFPVSSACCRSSGLCLCPPPGRRYPCQGFCRVAHAMKFDRSKRNRFAGFFDCQYFRMSDLMITEEPTCLSGTLHCYSAAVQLN